MVCFNRFRQPNATIGELELKFIDQLSVGPIVLMTQDDNLFGPWSLYTIQRKS
jgi:hypothetical protein